MIRAYSREKPFFIWQINVCIYFLFDVFLILFRIERCLYSPCLWFVLSLFFSVCICEHTVYFHRPKIIKHFNSFLWRMTHVKNEQHQKACKNNSNTLSNNIISPLIGCANWTGKKIMTNNAQNNFYSFFISSIPFSCSLLFCLFFFC